MKLEKLLSDVQEKFEIDSVEVVEAEGNKIHLIYPAESALDDVHAFINDATNEEGSELDAMDLRNGDINGFAVSDSTIDPKFNPVTIVPQTEEDDTEENNDDTEENTDEVEEGKKEGEEEEPEEEPEMSSEEIQDAVEKILKTESREDLASVLDTVIEKRSRSQARRGQTFSKVKGGKVVKVKKRTRRQTPAEKKAMRELHRGASAQKAKRAAQKPGAKRKRKKSAKRSRARGIGK